MLVLTTPSIELYDDEHEIFITIKSHTLQMEHSLVSLSKWESKWKKPYLTEEEKTTEEIRDYFRCMTITQNVDPNVYEYMTEATMTTIAEYMKDSYTATTVEDNRTGGRQRVITSELIYFWMTALQIDWKAEKWHLNRLLTLIRLANVENAPEKDKRFNKSESTKRARAIKAARRSRK